MPLYPVYFRYTIGHIQIVCFFPGQNIQHISVHAIILQQNSMLVSSSFQILARLVVCHMVLENNFFFHKRSKLKIKYFFGVGNFCMTCNFVRCIHGYLENRLTSIHGYLENRLNSAVWEGVNPFQLLVFFVMLKSSQKNQGALK